MYLVDLQDFYVSFASIPHLSYWKYFLLDTIICLALYIVFLLKKIVTNDVDKLSFPL